MIIDMKYHVATIVGIFLALGIGIMIGGVIGNNQSLNDLINEQQAELYDRLDEHVNTLTEENNELSNEINSLQSVLELHKQYENMVYPQLVAGRLEYRNIAVISTDSAFDIEFLANELDKASGNVVSSTLIKEQLTEVSEEQKSEIIDILESSGYDIEESDNDNTWLQVLSKALIDALLQNDNKELISYLINESLLSTTGDYGTEIDTVILVGGTEEEARAEFVDEIDLTIIDALLDNGLTVCGVERNDCKVSYIPNYQKKNITTVDNADTVIGETALVIALADGIEGNYGIKSTSRMMLPEE